MEKEVALLHDLGLSPSQAKVYLALVTLGSQTARSTYKVAQVARQDIYRILIELQHLGLVERIIAAPTRFKALPIQDGVSILLERKTKETTELHARVDELIDKYPEEVESSTHIEEPQFVFVPERVLARRVEKAVANAQKSMDFVFSWAKFSKWMFNQEEILKKLLKRGVKIRYVIEKPEYTKAMPDIVAEATSEDSLLLQCKYALTVNLAHLIVIDGKEMLIDASPTAAYGKTPVLWSNSRCLIVLAQNYFEEMWKNSVRLPQVTLQ